MKWLFITLCLMLSGCSILQPKMDFDAKTIQVEISPGEFVDLPQPSALQQDINVSQLISAQWGEENKQKLLVQLQVDQEKVVLAGFSAWGVKLLSITYFGKQSGNKIETHVMTGLGQTLPSPEQVLSNVMLSIWPLDSWKNPLASIGWTLQEANLQRLLIDENGHVVITIDYQKMPYLDGKITFKNQRLNYVVEIETK
ncbi:DUF3261 domain-containing protein [Psychromonas sp.]|nr:DUF3261 domain-containing protein [Psychromonas sp.]